jgi:NADH-quinone oxidoreductase subunit J
MSFEIILFSLVSLTAVVSAALMIFQRNPVKSILLLIVNFFCLAILYLLLSAQFIAIIQIIVYAGAIMVLFLFVIMLLNLGDENLLPEGKSYKKRLAYILGIALLIEIFAGLGLPYKLTELAVSPRASEIGTIQAIGRSLFGEYLLPFEITSILLLAAMVGVIILAKKKFQ